MVILPGHGQSYHIDEPNMYYMPVDLSGNMRGLTNNKHWDFYHMESNPLNLLGIALICSLIFFPNGARHKRRFDTRHAVTPGT